MDTPADRLRWARKRAKFETATDAARSFGWPVSTYLGHENGDRVPGRKTAQRYARALRVRWYWLLEGEGPAEAVAQTMQISGSINPSAKVSFDHAHKMNVSLPPDGGLDTIALVALGSVMPGVVEDGWIVYCEKSQRRPEDDDITKMALIASSDGEMVIARLFRGADPDRYDIMTLAFETRRNVEIAWISKVLWIKPT